MIKRTSPERSVKKGIQVRVPMRKGKLSRGARTTREKALKGGGEL